ncbi:AsmA-like C-terminal region-containing protein [Ascidiimonas aurantiaca]|uniref:AsmA family protein n=1 Tax=Ascidiimonas aurantiaca TaxID=1685432 RepID=UPI0030EE509E
MKKFKKILKVLVIVFSLLIVILIAAPMLFEDKIVGLIKSNINKNLNATLAIEDSDISLLRNFPKATVALKNISLVNHAPFEGDTLFAAGTLKLQLSVKELFKGAGTPLNIHSFSLDEAQLTILEDAEGNTNYDIAKPKSIEEGSKNKEASDFTLSLKEYSISNARVRYYTRESGIDMVIEDMNHSGKGDLSLTNSKLETRTEAVVSFEMDSINYLNRHPVKLNALLGIDLSQNKYSFLENEAFVHKLPLVFDGFVKVNENNQEVAITFETPSSDFRNFLAVIPETYVKNLETIETRGNFTVKGEINGLVDENSIPQFDISLISEDAMFKYPDLPKAVNDIKMRTRVVNKTGNTDDTYIDIEALSFRIDKDVFNAKARLEHLTTNPYVQADINGRLDLANVSKAYPISLTIPLKGILEADVTTAFDMEAVKTKNFARTRSKGQISLMGFEYQSDEMENPLLIKNTALTFNPTTVTLEELDATTGTSDIQASGTINNLIGFMVNKENLEGVFTLRSGSFTVSDFMMEEEREGTKDVQNSQNGEALKIPSFLDCTITAQADQVHYDNLTLKNVKGTLVIKDETASLKNLNSSLFDGQLALNGSVSTKQETPVFDMALGINAFNISESFKALELFKVLSPLAAAIQGKLNSALSLSGALNSDLTPNLSTISGDAVAELLASSLSPESSSALNILDNNLSFIDLKEVNLDNLKTSFTFENGQVTISPLQLKYKDVAIEVSGGHGFDRSLNYQATFNVPAKYLGKEVSSLLAGIEDREADEITVPVLASIGGSITAPEIRTDLKQAVTNLTQQLAERKKKQLVNKGKDAVKDALGGLLGKDQKKDTTQTDSVKKPDPLKKAAGGLFNKLLKNTKKEKDTTSVNKQ